MPSCTYCGKPIVPHSQACPECGTAQEPEAPKPELSPKLVKERRWASRRLGGLALFSIGLLATIASYNAAAASGASKFRFYPWFMVFGLLVFFFPSATATGAELEDNPQHLLAKAAALEGKDNHAAMHLYADIIRRFPNSTAAEEARRNVRTLSRQTAAA